MGEPTVDMPALSRIPAEIRLTTGGVSGVRLSLLAHVSTLLGSPEGVPSVDNVAARSGCEIEFRMPIVPIVSHPGFQA
jgi:hypothetical protein